MIKTVILVSIAGSNISRLIEPAPNVSPTPKLALGYSLPILNEL